MSGFEIDPPTGEIDLEDLLESRKRKYARKHQAAESRRMIRVRVKTKGPIGILHFGDPHVDDDGTDLAALERHTEIVNKTEGLFAANVGDTTNNWVGRLGRLYSEQSTTAAEAWALAEWFLTRVKWLYIIGGNHDAWSGAGDPIKWIARQTNSLYENSGARLQVVFPNKREVRINARHTFRGNSMWNPAHAAMRAAQMGCRDHVLIQGHKHISGYGLIKDENSGVVSHCIQVSSYKIHDRYAQEQGFTDHHISPCVVTILDPDATTEVGLVQVFHDPEQAAEFLTWLRKKRK